MSHTTSRTAVAFLTAFAVVALPGVSLAHGNDHHEIKISTAATMQRPEKNDNNNGDIQFRGLGAVGMFYKGTVSTTTPTGFMVTGKDKIVVTVNTANAKLIRIPNTTIALADIKVNDTVWVTGPRTGGVISANVVYVLAANVSPAKVKGTVSTITGNTLTLQTKNNKTITVTTTNDTLIIKADKTTGTTTDIHVGSAVTLWGLLDKVTHFFSALKIKIK